MVVAHKTAVPPDRNVRNETYFTTILTQAVELSERIPVKSAPEH
jgi:hypothetical protein